MRTSVQAERDKGPQGGATMEGPAMLKPAFKADYIDLRGKGH